MMQQPNDTAAAPLRFELPQPDIGAWRAGARPSTGPDPRFRLTGVLEKWRALLG